jgi:hypothetical protein
MLAVCNGCRSSHCRGQEYHFGDFGLRHAGVFGISAMHFEAIGHCVASATPSAISSL